MGVLSIDYGDWLLYVLFLYAVSSILGVELEALIFITSYVIRDTKAKWPAVLLLAGIIPVLLIAFNKRFRI